MLATLALATSLAHAQPRRPLGRDEIDAIARIEMLEDRRELDTTDLARSLRASRAEVRRRAAIAVGRIRDPRGLALLRAAPLDRDTAVAAATVFAVGQLHDSSAATVAWLDSLLASGTAPAGVLTEAAAALGKLKTAAARAALVRFLARARSTARTDDAIGDALLGVGRANARGDLAAVIRWSASRNPETRWRATWALFRARDPEAVATLLSLAQDRDAYVRSWAVRGLARPPADSAGLGERAESRLLAATRDVDRRVRAEAVRTLGTYADSAAVRALLDALASDDTWLAVSAAEGLGRVRGDVATRALVGAADASRPCALRVTALRALQSYAPDDAKRAAADVARDTVAFCHTAAQQIIQPPPRTPRPSPAPKPERTLDDYRRIVERWVVPEYAGKPRPRVVWTTPRGEIEIELYPGDAPLAVDDFMNGTGTRLVVGTEFIRVVPDFVDQQATIVGATRLRDEVSRRRLTRANLSWASSGLDTGTPGYTLGHTPQPHNEGDFTSLGRVVRGMDVVDRVQLGDAVTGARVVP